MELYVNNNWTERYTNSYIAEAIMWSENGNHAAMARHGVGCCGALILTGAFYMAHRRGQPPNY
jgi:hypothetical protein